MLCGIINDTRLLRLHSVRVLKIGAEHRCLCHVCIVVRAKHEIKHLALRCVCVCVCAVCARSVRSCLTIGQPMMLVMHSRI